MDTAPFKLRYTQDFIDDLNEIVDYISIDLCNPDAAQALADDVQAAIHERLRTPTAFEPYHSHIRLRSVYYQIRIRNFTAFYVVQEDVMEVRRILYSKRNWKEII